VGGTGFAGSWADDAETYQGMYVVSPGQIGRGNNNGLNAGSYANFASGGFSVAQGQLWISINIDNMGQAPLSSSRLDLNTGISNGSPIQGAYLGGVGQADFGFITSTNLGSSASAISSVPSIGDHHVVGVLDFTNDQIAIFVDPTGASYYAPNGTNNANAVAAWTPPGSDTITSYELVDNQSDIASYGDAVFSYNGAPAGVGVPEPGSIALLVGMGFTGASVLLRKRKTAGKAA